MKTLYRILAAAVLLFSATALAQPQIPTTAYTFGFMTNKTAADARGYLGFPVNGTGALTNNGSGTLGWFDLANVTGGTNYSFSAQFGILAKTNVYIASGSLQTNNIWKSGSTLVMQIYTGHPQVLLGDGVNDSDAGFPHLASALNSGYGINLATTGGYGEWIINQAARFRVDASGIKTTSSGSAGSPSLASTIATSSGLFWNANGNVSMTGGGIQYNQVGYAPFSSQTSSDTSLSQNVFTTGSSGSSLLLGKDGTTTTSTSDGNISADSGYNNGVSYRYNIYKAPATSPFTWNDYIMPGTVNPGTNGSGTIANMGSASGGYRMLIPALSTSGRGVHYSFAQAGSVAFEIGQYPTSTPGDTFDIGPFTSKFMRVYGGGFPNYSGQIIPASTNGIIELTDIGTRWSVTKATGSWNVYTNDANNQNLLLARYYGDGSTFGEQGLDSTQFGNNHITYSIKSGATVTNLIPTNIGASKLVGTDTLGILTNLVVGSGLSLSGGTLSATGGGVSFDAVTADAASSAINNTTFTNRMRYTNATAAAQSFTLAFGLANATSLGFVSGDDANPSTGGSGNQWLNTFQNAASSTAGPFRVVVRGTNSLWSSYNTAQTYLVAGTAAYPTLTSGDGSSGVYWTSTVRMRVGAAAFADRLDFAGNGTVQLVAGSQEYIGLNDAGDSGGVMLYDSSGAAKMSAGYAGLNNRGLSYKRRHAVKTANDTLVANVAVNPGGEETGSGMLYSNNGASGSVTLTLPAEANNARDTWFEFSVETAQAFIIKPAGTDTINVAGVSSTASTGDVRSSTVGAVIRIQGTGTAGVWMACSGELAWTIN